jgi:hypothetical protein
MGEVLEVGGKLLKFGPKQSSEPNSGRLDCSQSQPHKLDHSTWFYPKQANTVICWNKSEIQRCFLQYTD